MEPKLGFLPVNFGDRDSTCLSRCINLPRSHRQEISEGKREDDRDLDSDKRGLERLPEKTVPDDRDNRNNHLASYPSRLRRYCQFHLRKRNRTQLFAWSSLLAVCSLRGPLFCHERERPIDRGSRKIDLRGVEGGYTGRRSSRTGSHQHEPVGTVRSLCYLSGSRNSSWIRIRCFIGRPVRSAWRRNIHKVRRRWSRPRREGGGELP